VRRSRLVTGAVVAAFMLAAVAMATAQAASPSRSTYTVFMTICEGAASPERDAGPTVHAPGSWHTGDDFFLVGGRWVPSGTFRVDVDQASWGAAGGTSSGTFAMRGSLVGDYDGRWAWNWKQGQDGHGVGQGVASSKGDHVKVDFLILDPVGLPVPPDDGCGAAPMYGYGFLAVSTY
jgi:hypothetical protein